MKADPHAFVSAEAHYARFRPHYPPALYALLARRFALNGMQQALDLGCGPGTVALELADHVAEVIAVDPAAGMLEHGRLLARERGITNICWQQGESVDLPALGLPLLDLTVMAKSFHWMNRDQVLADLDQRTAPRGGIVILSGGPPGTTALPGWAAVVAEVRAAYLGTVRRAGRGVYPEPEETYRATLERSAFSAVTLVSFDQPVVRSLDELVGLQLSNSYSTPAQLGPRREEFEHDLRRALTAFDPSGRYPETIHTQALFAVRP
ncbi:methyltransferase domain-containing protein [Streptomyces lasiicapitis]|uniref:class I SAM-dependent methyltransferase n=1 Tax=Streptomyces lasiicapitis TaxID=1923961 RepID=UPI00331C70F0